MSTNIQEKLSKLSERSKKRGSDSDSHYQDQDESGIGAVNSNEQSLDALLNAGKSYDTIMMRVKIPETRRNTIDELREHMIKLQEYLVTIRSLLSDGGNLWILTHDSTLPQPAVNIKIESDYSEHHPAHQKECARAYLASILGISKDGPIYHPKWKVPLVLRYNEVDFQSAKVTSDQYSEAPDDAWFVFISGNTNQGFKIAGLVAKGDLIGDSGTGTYSTSSMMKNDSLWHFVTMKSGEMSLFPERLIIAAQNLGYWINSEYIIASDEDRYHSKLWWLSNSDRLQHDESMMRNSLLRDVSDNDTIIKMCIKKSGVENPTSLSIGMQNDITTDTLGDIL